MSLLCLDCGREIPTADPLEACPACLMELASIDYGEGFSSASVVEEPNMETRYRTLGEHARGGMGRVLLAFDTQFKRRVAVKELSPAGRAREGHGPAVSRALERRFLQEAHVLARLEHPGIVPVYEIGWRPDGTPFYVMRFVEGRTLHDAIQDAPTLQQRLGLLPAFVGVCQAVAFAHSRGVLHRDLKPLNVLLGKYGEAVVIDWGLAKLTQAVHNDFEATFPDDFPEADWSPVRTRAGEAMGTPQYMSPEQAQGRRDDVDERSDVYALGAMLYEVLTGSPPFKGSSMGEILGKVSTGSLSPPHVLEPEAPRELGDICLRAMARHPADRYASVDELMAELARFQSGALVDAHRYSLRELLLRALRRHRLPIAIGAVSLAALAVVGVLSYRNIVRARDAERAQRVAAERDNYYLSMRVARANLGERRYDAAREILWKTPEARRNWEWGLLLRDANLEKWVIDVPGNISDLALSPDGTKVAVGAKDGPSRVWTSWPLVELPPLNGHTAAVTTIAFSPEGERIVTGAADNTARVWKVATGEVLAVLSGHEAPLRKAAFCGGGAHVVTVSEDRTVRLWDARSGEPLTTLGRHDAEPRRLAVSPDGRYLLTGDQGGGLCLWDERAKTLVAALPGHHAVIKDIRFSHAGSLAASVDKAGEIFLWSIPDGRFLRALKGHVGSVESVDFNQDDTRLITGSEDMSARVWNVADGALQITERELRSDANTVRFTPDGQRMLAATWDGFIRVWDAQDGAWLTTLGGGELQVTNVAMSPDNRTIYAAMSTRLFAFDLNHGDVRAALHGHGNSVTGFTFRADGQEMATLAGYTRDTSFTQIPTKPERSPGARWTQRDFQLLERMHPMPAGVLAGTYQGETLLVLTHDGCLRDGKTGTVWNRLGGAEHDLFDAVFSPDGEKVLTLPRGAPGATLWDTRTGQRLVTVKPDENVMCCAAFSWDGRRFATSAGATPIYVFDAANGDVIKAIATDKDWTQALAFSHDGKRIASGCPNTMNASVWRIDTGQRMAVLKGHRSPVLGIAFSPDDTRIASVGSWDTATRIWDTDTGAEVLKLVGPEEMAVSVAWSPDGRQVFTGYINGNALVWEAAPWREANLPGDPADPWETRFYNVWRGDALMNHTQYPRPQ